jgi:hypothetical protein
MGLRWWMAVVDRGVVVWDEWGLVVASANIGEDGFCRMRLPTSIGTRLACAATLLSFYFYFVSISSTQTTAIVSHSGSWIQSHMSISFQYHSGLAASIVRPRIYP